MQRRLTWAGVWRWCGRRALKMEAKEQGKLLQDKAALEVKVREQTATLEMVQTQRNELKQSYKARSFRPPACLADQTAFACML